MFSQTAPPSLPTSQIKLKLEAAKSTTNFAKKNLTQNFSGLQIFLGPKIFRAQNYLAPNIFWHERRRCSRSPSGGQLATTLVDRYFHHYWHERSALQSVAVQAVDWQRRQWPLKTSLFSFLFSPPFHHFILRRDLFSQKECSDQKTYLAKVARNGQ